MNSALDLQNLVQGFKLSCQTEGKSSKTIEWYTCFLQRFLQFIHMNHYPVEVNEIDKTHIRAFVLYLQQQAIRRLAQKAGMQDVKCHPHIFRHTFATMFSVKGGSPEILQLIMGHESFQTTQKYLHPQS